MKKHKLEITIAAIFGALLVGLLWTTLAAKIAALPFVLLGICVAVLAAAIFPWSDKNSQDGVHERYAPKFFAQTILSSVVGIIIIVGLAAVLNRDRFSKTFDLTERKVNSLSSETIKFISNLEKDVRIYCIPSMDPRQDYCGDNAYLRQLYAQNANGKLMHAAVNPADIATLQQVRPAGYERLVLMTDNNRSEVVGKITESKLTNGLINLIKSKKTVYFLAGSGEPSINSDGDKNYSSLVEILKNRAYEAKEHLITNGDLPDDAKLVVAGSTPVAYSSVVETMLRKFLARGGKLILTINPYRDPGLHKLFSDLGLKLENTLLINNGGATQLGAQLAQAFPMRPPIVIGEYNRESPMTSPIQPNQIGIVDGARPLTALSDQGAQDGAFKLKHTQLISAFHAAPVTLTDEQRNRLNLEGTLGVKPNPNFDSKATYPVAWDVEIDSPSKLSEDIPTAQLASKDGTGAKAKEEPKNDTKAEVVVYGFETIGQYAQVAPGNAVILPLAISHLYQDKDLVSIPNKDFAPKQFNLERNPAQYLFLFAGLLPIATALAGFYIWMRRRSA